MFEQIPLPGVGTHPHPRPRHRPAIKTKADETDRIFFAVLPDAGAISSIRSCVRKQRVWHGLHGHPIIDGRLHISLFGLGDFHGVPVSLVKNVSRAAAMVSLPAFDVSFNQTYTFAHTNSDTSRRKPFVLVEGDKGKGLVELQNSLIACLRDVGLRINTLSGFTPHVTLLYDKKCVEEEAVTPVGWRVREFFLVRSKIGDVSRPYDILGRWPLPG